MARARPPPKYAAIRRIALGLPGASEEIYHGPWFKVGTKSFVNFWEPEGRWIFKLPKDLQEIYFEARGDTFQPMTHGALRWSYVAVENLGPRGDPPPRNGRLAHGRAEEAPEGIR